jgi:hypothetical protein
LFLDPAAFIPLPQRDFDPGHGIGKARIRQPGRVAWKLLVNFTAGEANCLSNRKPPRESFVEGLSEGGGGLIGDRSEGSDEPATTELHKLGAPSTQAR